MTTFEDNQPSSPTFNPQPTSPTSSLPSSLSSSNPQPSLSNSQPTSSTSSLPSSLSSSNPQPSLFNPQPTSPTSSFNSQPTSSFNQLRFISPQSTPKQPNENVKFILKTILIIFEIILILFLIFLFVKVNQIKNNLYILSNDGNYYWEKKEDILVGSEQTDFALTNASSTLGRRRLRGLSPNGCGRRYGGNSVPVSQDRKSVV